MTPLPPEKLRELCIAVLEADKYATPAPWKFDSGNMDIEADTPGVPWHRMEIFRLTGHYERARTFGETVLIEPPADEYSDGELVELYRTAAPELAAALLAFLTVADAKRHQAWAAESNANGVVKR